MFRSASAGAGALAGAAALALTFLAPASVATDGQVPLGFTDFGTSPCGPDNTTLVQLASSGPSYTTPGPGVLTSFATRAEAGTPGKVRLLVFVAGSTAGHFTLVAKSAPTAVTPGSLNTFPVRVPVPAGAMLGLTISNGTMDCAVDTGDNADVAAVGFGYDPDASTDLSAGANSPTLRANIAATWEPDADGDGFGDVTQDSCPRSALTQSCPAPDTKVKRKPKKVTTSRTVRMKLKSSLSSGTFTCAVDGGKAKSCASTYKRAFGYGNHVIVVTAVSAYGVADPTPVRVKFRVVRPAPK